MWVTKAQLQAELDALAAQIGDERERFERLMDVLQQQLQLAIEQSKALQALLTNMHADDTPGTSRVMRDEDEVRLHAHRMGMTFDEYAEQFTI